MQDSSQASDVFGAIAAPVRRTMLDRLAARETPVSDLASSFDMSLSAVSQHLAILREAGLVAQRKAGKQRLYRATPGPLRHVAEWIESYEEFWVEKLNDLGAYLEEAE